MVPQPPPAVVALHVWGTGRLAGALRMATTRPALRRLPGVRFVTLLGTGSGRSFALRDADLSHWAVLSCWESATAFRAYEQSVPFRSWQRVAHESARFVLRPLRSRGRWSGRRPFGDPAPAAWTGPVAAVTRARVRPVHWPAFWRAVAPVADDAHRGAGPSFAIAIGEAPVGLQGTFSVWRDTASLDDFAYAREPHRDVIRRTQESGWYAEELFARFAVLDMSGTYRASPVT